MLSFDPNSEPVEPKDAATVVVVRERSSSSEPGIELFCVERHAHSSFLGGAVVFPGGKVDPADREGHWQHLSTPLGRRALRFGGDEPEARAFAVAALRELLEEAAILPIDGARLDSEQAIEWRRALSRFDEGGAPRAQAFAKLLSEHGVKADASRLEALWRWITPAAEPRRYDTRFYVLPLPEGQVGLHDHHETTSSFWATPRELLSRWERGEIFLAPPTSRTIEIFLQAQSILDALEIARAQSLEPVCPAFAMHGEQVVLALPGDPLYPEPHAAPEAGAPTRFVWEDGRFVGKRASD